MLLSASQVLCWVFSVFTCFVTWKMQLLNSSILNCSLRSAYPDDDAVPFVFFLLFSLSAEQKKKKVRWMHKKKNNEEKQGSRKERKKWPLTRRTKWYTKKKQVFIAFANEVAFFFLSLLLIECLKTGKKTRQHYRVFCPSKKSD